MASPMKPATNSLLGPAVELLGRAALCDDAVVHHDDLVADRERLALVVRDVGHRELQALLQVRISSRISRRRRASRLDSGSSNSSTAGSSTSARASATRCCWPPESSLGRRSSKPTSPTPRSASRARAARFVLAHAAHAQAVAHVLDHVHVREQRVALEHHAHVALGRAQRGDVAPAHEDRAARSATPAPRSCAAWWSCRSPTGRGWWSACPPAPRS